MRSLTVLISADIEGISGVVLPEHATIGHGEYERFRRLMTAEVNAAVIGALEGGAGRTIVNDSHGKMANILIEELDPRAELISGSPKPYGMMQGIGPEIDRAFFVGYHAASGSLGAVLEHTVNDRIIGVSLNGQAVGEVGMNAALAGHFNVPVILVTGDVAVTREAVTLLGQIETVDVKEGITRTSARCLNPQIARDQIRNAARRALARTNCSGFLPERPLCVRLVFQRAGHADMAMLVPGSTRIDGRTVEWTGPDMLSVYQVYRAMAVLSGAA
jgi:D-amino peptidase